MHAFCRVLIAGLAYCVVLSGSASAQDSAADALLASHRGAIVQLQVQGKINNKLTFQNGTGFLFQTSSGPRIITAGHVIGRDTQWDIPRERCIYYRLAQNGSSQAYDCVVDAKVEEDIDLAEVYLDPFSAPTLEVLSSPLALGSDLAVTSWRSWGQPGSRATAQGARLLDLQKDRMILSGSYERSDSGSPVLDGQGRVVGLMIEATTQPGGQTQGIALTAARISAALSRPPVRRTPLPTLASFSEGKIIVDASAVVTQFGCVFLGKRSASVTQR